MVNLGNRREFLACAGAALLSGSSRHPAGVQAPSIEALRDLLNRGEVHVSLAAGVHVVDRPLRIPSGAAVVGAGQGQTVLQASTRLGARAPVDHMDGAGGRLQALTIFGAPDDGNLA